VSADSARRLIHALADRGETLSTAESCTGGGILTALTAVPGSSAAVWGGIVAYANDAKIRLLDVDRGLIERDGAVSSGVAKSMAWAIRRQSGSDWSVSVTGIAGPDGGSPEKPVGTVWIGWAAPDGNVVARLYQFDGDREAVRRQTVEYAIEGVLALLDSASTH